MRVMLPLFSTLLLWTSSVYAEMSQYQDVIMHRAATATADGSFLNVHKAVTVRLDVEITGTATVSFNIAGAGNYGWYPKLCTPSDSTTGATSTDVSGVFYCLVSGANAFEAPITAYTSGTVTVVGRATTSR